MSRKSRTEIQFFTNKKLQTPPLPKLPPIYANSLQAVMTDENDGRWHFLPPEGVPVLLSRSYQFKQTHPKHLMIDENSAGCPFLSSTRRTWYVVEEKKGKQKSQVSSMDTWDFLNYDILLK